MPSLDVLVLAALETVRVGLPTILDAMRGRTDYRRCDSRLDSWSRRLLEQAAVDLVCSGSEHLQDGQSYVVMSNHQSHYDIPVLFQTLRMPVRMVAKTELFRIPVLGRAMHDSGFVEIDRTDRRRALESLRLAGQRIVNDRLSIWIAPEGTRSKDGRLGPFKSGGFHLAMQAMVPILPISIDGTLAVHRAGDSTVHRGRTVRATIHPPVDTSAYQKGQLAPLMDTVRDRISSGLAAAVA